MSRKRGSLVLVVLGLLLLALLWWRFGGGGRGGRSAGASDRATAAAGGAAGAAGAKAGAAGRAAAEPPDIRRLPRGSIAGMVRDDHGAAVAGAEVCTNPNSRDLAQEETREPICVQSDAGGGYRIADLPPAKYSVSASAPRLVPGRWKGADGVDWLRLAPGEQRTGVDVLLRSGAVEIRGVVKDLSGGVVAGASVFVNSGSGRRGAGWSHALTDAQGLFVTWGAPGDVYATASAEGYAAGHKPGVAPGQFLEILLTPESVLAGRVVEVGTGRPVARARVETEADYTPGEWSGGSAFTDEQGRFRITRLRPGRYKPTAESPAGYGEAAESVLLGLGQTVDGVVIELHGAFVVRGRLVEADGERGCPDGWVSLNDAEHQRTRSAETEVDGSVELRAVLAGTYEVRVGCDDAVAAESYPPVTVADQDVGGLLWQLRSGRVIRGQVVSGEGAPVPDVWVDVSMSGGDLRGQRTQGGEITDAAGRFEAKGLLPGTYLLEATPRNQPTPADPTKVELAADRDADVTIRLDRGGTIEGSVVDETSAPVPDVEVHARGARAGGWRQRGTTRDDGAFTIEGVPAGDYRVVASRGWSEQLRQPGRGDDDVQGERVTVAVGRTARVRLVVESERGTIHGRVLDAAGNPVGDAYVDAQRESEAAGAADGSARRDMRWGFSRRPVLTDVEGTFTVEKLSRGLYTVRAWRRGGGEAFAEHVALGTECTLRIAETGSIAGVVAIEGGGAPEQITVTVADERAGFERSEAFFRTGGRFVMRDLPTGEYLVAVRAPEGNASEKVTLAQGEQKEGLTFALAGLTTITGQVVSLTDGTPLPGMGAYAILVKGELDGFDRDSKHRNVTDATGRFEVQRAPTGRVNVTVWPIEWDTSEWSYGQVVVNVPRGAGFDAGVIQVPRRRTKSNERAGDLGFTLREQPPDIDPEQVTLVVALVRPDGPAVSSGLVAGDEIIAVDGQDVSGLRAYLYKTLTGVPPGTTVSLGLRRGATVQITAGKPL